MPRRGGKPGRARIFGSLLALATYAGVVVAGDEERLVIVLLNPALVSNDANGFAEEVMGDKDLQATLLDPVGAWSYGGLPSLPTGAGLNLSDPYHPEAVTRRYVTLEYSTGAVAQSFLQAAQEDERFLAVMQVDDTQVQFSRGNFALEPLSSSQWGPNLVDLPYVLLNYTTGTASIAPVDSGVETTHPDIAPQLRPHLSYGAPSGGTQFITGDISELTVQGGRGHGTHVAGILAAALNQVGVGGTCPTCSLSYLRSILIADLPGMLKKGHELGIQAIGLSFDTWPNGGGCPSSLETVAPGLESTVAVLHGRNVTMVASSGNGRDSRVDCPAEDPGNRVIAVGGMHNAGSGAFWDEAAFNTPGCGGAGPGSGCGSNWGSGVNGNDLVAPARQVLSTISFTWNPTCSDATVPPANYGWCTGTSMSTPFVVATAGLLRSVNPLLAATETRQALTASAVSIGDSRAGAGRVSVRGAVEKALGRVNGAVVPNRLTPLLALTSTDAELNDPSETGARDWLYTTSPQLAIAARLGEIYNNPSYNVPPQSGVSGSIVYATSTAGGTIKKVDGEYNIYPGFVTESARAIAYVFATERDPRGSSLPDLVPLYRLSGNGPDAFEGCSGASGYRQHTYASALVGSGNGSVQQFESQSTSCPADRKLRRFQLDRIEGFMFSPSQPQPANTHALVRVYSETHRSWALALDFELPGGSNPNPAYAGFAPPANYGTGVLGFVYANHDPVRNVLRDTDDDGLIDAYEQLIGTNLLSPDSDADCSSDLFEFPIVGLSNSDPLINNTTGFADLAIAVTVQTIPGGKRLNLTVSNGCGAPSPAVNDVSITLNPGTGFAWFADPPTPAGCTLLPPPNPPIGIPVLEYICDFAAIPAGTTSAPKSFDILPFTPSHVLTVTGSLPSPLPLPDPAPGNNSINPPLQVSF